jgi:hypothetical protein
MVVPQDEPHPRRLAATEGDDAMPWFTIHTAESAPAGSKEPLALLEQRIGFLPNLAGTMAGSPTLIGSFVGLQRRLQASTLTGLEPR